MMLTTCPECSLPVSDKAIDCPHCGYPLKNDAPRRTPSRKKRMRLPNGFGQISEIKSENLRNRFRVMVTVGKTDEGKPICRILKPKGYFSTYNEAYAALVEYNKDPYDLTSTATMEEMHSKWVEKHYPTLTGKSLKGTYDKAWKRCSQIKSMRVIDVRPKHLKACIENAPTPVTKKHMKMMLNLLYDFAVSEEYVDRNYARQFQLDKSVGAQAAANRKSHVAFGSEELETLWKYVDEVTYVDVILIQCFMGWRPRELCLLKIVDVNLEKQIVVGGMKTAAGTMRTVPIHPKIQPIVRRKYDEAKSSNSEYLITCPDSGNGIMTYSKYRERFIRAMERLGITGHQPHDPRKTFVSMCKSANVDEYAIKRMVGHSINDVTEGVYTERTIQWLTDELLKI